MLSHGHLQVLVQSSSFAFCVLMDNNRQEPYFDQGQDRLHRFCPTQLCHGSWGGHKPLDMFPPQLARQTSANMVLVAAARARITLVLLLVGWGFY